MIYKIVAIRDRAIDAFGTPFFVTALGHATRSFKNEINREGSEFGRNPEDYDMYVIGTYDDADGSLVAEKPNMIAIGKDQIVNKE